MVVCFRGSLGVTSHHLALASAARSVRVWPFQGKHAWCHSCKPGEKGTSLASTWKRNPQTLPHCVWITWKPAMLSKFVFSHLLTRLLLSKSPSAHPMICFQGRSRLILNGWFITPSLRRIVEPCHLNFRTPVPFLFTFCLPSDLLQVLLWEDAFCSLRVWLL